MDFMSGDWDVTGEASHLVDSLFGAQTKKGKKRKQILDTTSDGEKVKKLRDNDSGAGLTQKMKSANFTQDSKEALQTDNKKKKKKKNKKKVNDTGAETSSGTNINTAISHPNKTDSHTENVAQKHGQLGGINSVKAAVTNTAIEHGQKNAKQFTTIKNSNEVLETGQSHDVVQANKRKQHQIDVRKQHQLDVRKQHQIDVRKKVEEDRLKRKMSTNTSGNDFNNDANNSANTMKKKQQQNGPDKAAEQHPKASENVNVNDSKSNTIKKKNEDKSKLSGENNEDNAINEQTEKTKKKRKRKCKKNKFKDYSTEEKSNDILKSSKQTGLKEDATIGGDLDESATSPSQNGNIQMSNHKDETIPEGKQKKKKKNRKKKKSEATSIKSSDTGLQPGANKVTKGQAIPVSMATSEKKSKIPFDPKELNAILNPRKLFKSSSSLNNKDSSDETRELHNDEEQIGSQEDGPDQAMEKPTANMSFLEKSRQRLNAARFRYINEQLYSSTGQEAYKLFKGDKEAFNVYHEGFQAQVEKWPTNPVDTIISQIKSRPKAFIVADFGCGDAKLSRSVPHKVHSFDLVALNKFVTVCDIAKVPLSGKSVDVAVFCLSLMGTNLTAYLNEASRVLKQGGTLLIAEVTSRFPNLGKFVSSVEMLGFKLKKKDINNKMFVLMDFKRTAQALPSDQIIKLQPCVYKKR